MYEWAVIRPELRRCACDLVQSTHVSSTVGNALSLNWRVFPLGVYRAVLVRRSWFLSLHVHPFPRMYDLGFVRVRCRNLAGAEHGEVANGSTAASWRDCLRGAGVDDILDLSRVRPFPL